MSHSYHPVTTVLQMITVHGREAACQSMFSAQLSTCWLQSSSHHVSLTVLSTQFTQLFTDNKSLSSFIRCCKDDNARICCWLQCCCGYGVKGSHACCRRAVQQLIDIDCQWGPQQQTHYGTRWDRQSDGRIATQTLLHTTNQNHAANTCFKSNAIKLTDMISLVLFLWSSIYHASYPKCMCMHTAL